MSDMKFKKYESIRRKILETLNSENLQSIEIVQIYMTLLVEALVHAPYDDNQIKEIFDSLAQKLIEFRGEKNGN